MRRGKTTIFLLTILFAAVAVLFGRNEIGARNFPFSVTVTSDGVQEEIHCMKIIKFINKLIFQYTISSCGLHPYDSLLFSLPPLPPFSLPEVLEIARCNLMPSGRTKTDSWEFSED